MFKVLIAEKAARELGELPDKLKDNITKKLNVLEQSGFSQLLDIKKLKGYKRHYRLRVGDFRILFYFENPDVIVYKMGERENVYE